MLPKINIKPTNSWRFKLGRYLLKSLGFHVAMIKICDGTTTIEGDRELVKYVDFTGYIFNKEPLKRK
jgi:hypothetical protein